jgi:hypothetical protein
MSKSPNTDKHRFALIPDTQVRPGVPLDHLDWVGQALVDYAPDVIVHLGDHYDMPSLQQHDKPGSLRTEGQRYAQDIEIGKVGAAKISTPINREIKRQSRNKKHWKPDRHYLLGNHEYRTTRAVEQDPKLIGSLDIRDCTIDGFKRHDFLEKVWIDGIVFSHYFQSNGSKFAIGGSIDNRLNKIGDSFAMGHQQGLVYGCRQYPTGDTRHGLVAGSCYVHREEYRGNQGQRHWRGIVILNEVHRGDYCIMPLTLDYLCRRYEGVDLVHYMRKKYKKQDWSHLE